MLAGSSTLPVSGNFKLDALNGQGLLGLLKLSFLKKILKIVFGTVFGSFNILFSAVN
jgi:hypothetical protein